MSEQFGSYVIHDELGVGGMATVHLAESRTKGGVLRRVALKRLFSHIADIPELRESFIHEARLARYLRHPNIAQVYEYGRYRGVYFIAFEFVPGPTMQQLARQCDAHVGPIPIPVILAIGRQICDALDHAHNIRDEHGQPLGVVHRDVSPQNLIVSNSGVVKLIDFGLAKAKQSSVHSQAGIIKGKLGYVAPEYLAGKLDARCDLWAVGVVLHELLTNRRLFDFDDDRAILERVRSAPVSPPSRFNPEVSVGLDEIVLTALQRDPARRWQSAATMGSALTAHAKQTRELTPSQLVAWIEWAFSQKKRLREDSGVSALIDIVESGQIEEVEDQEEATVAIRLPSISAAMMERRRESVAMAPVGAAMLGRHAAMPSAPSQSRIWLWIAIALLVVAAGAVAIAKFGVPDY